MGWSLFWSHQPYWTPVTNINCKKGELGGFWDEFGNNETTWTGILETTNGQNTLTFFHLANFNQLFSSWKTWKVKAYTPHWQWLWEVLIPLKPPRVERHTQWDKVSCWATEEAIMYTSWYLTNVWFHPSRPMTLFSCGCDHRAGWRIFVLSLWQWWTGL